MLLPDAPPRKRQSRKISPERQLCVMAPPRRLHVASELSAGNFAAASGVASTSAASFSSELNVGLLETSPIVEYVGDWPGEPDTTAIPDKAVGAEVVIATSSSSNVRPSQIGVNDNRYAGIMGEWLEHCDSDDDGLVQDRTVQEPACETDMTPFQSEVLHREDVANDLARSTYHLQIGTQDKYNRLTCKPDIVLDYNKSMGGVDRKDQFLSAQPMERLRNRVWYKKLFRRLYNAAIFNCFVM